MNILVLGATGYTGSRLVQALIQRGHRIRALVRSLDQVQALERQGVEVRIGDLSRQADVQTIGQDQEIIYHVAAYCRSDPPEMQGILGSGTTNLIELADRSTLQKLVWASNVSVYGRPNTNARLDEETPAKPAYPLGVATLDAEKRLSDTLPSIAVRVTSVYGPGRDYIDSIREGRVRLLNGGTNWQSRIHVDDLVRVLLAAAEAGRPGQTYIAADDQPTTLKEFFSEIALALGAPVPQTLEIKAAKAFGVVTRGLNWLAGQSQYALNENVIELLTANYNCRNDKIKKELGVQLEYPSYLDAYEEMLTGNKRKGSTTTGQDSK